MNSLSSLNEGRTDTSTGRLIPCDNKSVVFTQTATLTDVIEGKSFLCYPASSLFDLPRSVGKRMETLLAPSIFFEVPLIRENG